MFLHAPACGPAYRLAFRRTRVYSGVLRCAQVAQVPVRVAGTMHMSSRPSRPLQASRISLTAERRSAPSVFQQSSGADQAHERVPNVCRTAFVQ